MPNTFPPEIGQFVQQELAGHVYKSRDDLVIDAVRVLRELTLRYQKLKDDVQQAIVQADRGEVMVLDSSATRAKARKRMAE